MFKKSKNWLLVMPGISFCLAFLLYSVIGYEVVYKGARNFSDMPFNLNLVMILIWAPIFEEVIFRGFFVEKKWIKIIAFIGLPLFVLFNSINFINVSVLILFIAVYFTTKTYKKEINNNLAIILNVVLFSVLHWSFYELGSLNFFFYPLFQLSSGCILIWITINYKILKAMLFHFIWNACFTALLLYNLQFPKKEVQTYTNDVLTVEWSRLPRFNDEKSTIDFGENYIKANNVEAITLYRLISDSLNSNSRILQTEPYMKYNFELTLKKNSLDRRFLENKTKNFLKKHDIIYVIEK